LSLLTELIFSYTGSFDDASYPPDVYFHLLDLIREATSGDQLGTALTHALAWKDGRIRLDANGQHTTLSTHASYLVEQTKSDVMNSDDQQLLNSDEFFTWACRVRRLQRFDSGLINDLQSKFKLWSSIAIPVFVLHCLRPQIYPVVDRYVIVLFNILQPQQMVRKNPRKITLQTYCSYHAWWLRLLNEAGISPLSAEINQLKDIDAGISAFGKSLSTRANNILQSSGDEISPPIDHPTSGTHESIHTQSRRHDAPGTESGQFKRRAIFLWKEKGKTQASAIKVAAEEMGIELKKSYIAYPGSHFDRWRKQGYGN